MRTSLRARSNMFEQPFNFVKKINHGKHIVLFYEELCVYISEEDKETVKREMFDAGINIHNCIKNDLLLIYQLPNLAASRIHQIALERLAQITLHPWKRGDQPYRLVLRCFFKVDTEEQIKSNLKWEHDYRYRDLKGLQGTMICTYPVNYHTNYFRLGKLWKMDE